MPDALSALLARIAAGDAPRVVLVGGDSEYLAERAFHDIRDAIVAKQPGIALESYEAGAELAAILDSYRTASLFASARLIVVAEVNAFVSAKQIASLYDKAMADWKSAKTDKKRASSSAKLLHTLGLAGTDLDATDRSIADALGVALDNTLTDMLAFCRGTGKKASRGEDDAALLMEAIGRGGAQGTILLLRTGEIPRDSATTDLVKRNGVVLECDLTREGFTTALDHAIADIANDAKVKFEPRAVMALRQRLGIERMLADKFSRDVPEIRVAVSEAERLATLAGEGGRVDAAMVDREVATLEGGARYEFGSLFTEGKIIEAVVKLRELVAQARREDPRASIDIQYGKFLFPLADEIRQMIAIHSFARAASLNLRQSMQYNRFKDTIAEKLGDYMKNAGVVRQRPHPFPLHKKWSAAGAQREEDLWSALAFVAELDVKRKSGGVPVDVGIEMFLLSRVRNQ
jgi:DNA polymerase III delta subunit